MDAPEIASPGHIPDDNGSFIPGKLEKMGGQSARFPVVPQHIRRLHRPAVKFGNTNHIITLIELNSAIAIFRSSL